MMSDYNNQEFFSGITEDYSNFRWYKGENENPYLNDREHPLAARFWEYEKEFFMNYLDKADTSVLLSLMSNGRMNCLMSIYLEILPILMVIRLTGLKSSKQERDDISKNLRGRNFDSH